MELFDKVSKIHGSNAFGSAQKEVVGTTGFEPATPASRTLCSTRLSHVPTILLIYPKENYWASKNYQDGLLSLLCS